MEQGSNDTKVIYDNLTSKEREKLLALYADDELKQLFIKVVDTYQKDKAMKTMLSSPNNEYTILMRGKIYGARIIIDLMQYILTVKETATKKNNEAALKEEEKAK